MKDKTNIEEQLGTLSLEEGKIRVSSRDICPGDIFFAIRGTCSDGHDFIGEALQKGAGGIVCEKLPSSVPGSKEARFLVCDDSRKALALAARHAYGDPSSRLITFGVTGTNGKTTTATLIKYLLDFCKKDSGIVSTVSTGVRVGHQVSSRMTTPDALELNRLLKEMVDNRLQAAAVEISSHALSQRRVHGIGFDAVVFTNISRDHMDYHHTMENYFRDKCRIFELKKPVGSAVVNCDDEFLKNHIENADIEGLVTYGFSRGADVRAVKPHYGRDGSVFGLEMGSRPIVEIKSPLVGEYNIFNVLAASAAVCSVTEISPEEVRSALMRFSAPRGLLQRSCLEAPFTVLIDYAHTPGALDKVLSSVREVTAGRLICVVGCGGDRDKGKRPIMGSIASSGSDLAVFTSDNPRSEEPGAIIDQMLSGECGDNVITIESRREAIEFALRDAAQGDTVLIAGKGHETYQEFKDCKQNFDDNAVAEEIFKKISVLSEL